MENLHLGVKLGVAPFFIVFIRLKGVTLLHKEIKVCKAGSIISEGDVVMLPTFRFNWCWTPQVTVYLSSKDLGTLALLLLQNQLPCGFNIDTKLAETVQRKAALLVTGALRTTPSDLLFAHTNMLPLRYHIKLICHGSALRIATLPKEHPLHVMARQAMGRRLCQHTSPLYNILNSAGIRTNNIEIVNTIAKHPTWRNHIKTIIAKTREEAEQSAKDDKSDIRIYTDGSSHDGGVGAAAILMQGIHLVKIARYHLGRDTKHTVYESECTSQILALKMLQKLGQDLNGLDVMMATDNQAML